MSVSIKKHFQELYNFLESNKNKRVSEIFTEITELSQLSRKKSFLGDCLIAKSYEPSKQFKGYISAYCSFYNKYMPLVGSKAVQFGTKTAAVTGLNSMCLEGATLWSRQNLSIRKRREAVVKAITKGDFTPELQKELQDVEKLSKVTPKSDKGFSTKQEILNYFKTEKIPVDNETEFLVG